MSDFAVGDPVNVVATINGRDVKLREGVIASAGDGPGEWAVTCQMNGRPRTQSEPARAAGCVPTAGSGVRRAAGVMIAIPGGSRGAPGSGQWSQAHDAPQLETPMRQTLTSVSTLPRIIARFFAEVVIDDNYVTVDPQGEDRYDVTAEVLALGRNKALAMRDNQNASDELRQAAGAPDWVQRWDGPFRIEVAESIRDYFDALDEMDRTASAFEAAAAQTRVGVAAIKDMQGREYFVRASDLAGGRTLMRMCDPVTGDPLRSSGRIDSPSVYFHRGNICSHPRESFVTVRALGSSWDECPVCREKVDREVSRLLDREAIAA